MKFLLKSWQLMLLELARANREQQTRIKNLQTEFAVLKQQIGKRRIVLTDDQRRRLAFKGKTIGRRDLVNKLIVPMDRPPDLGAEIETTACIGGLLRSYRRVASFGPRSA